MLDLPLRAFLQRPHLTDKTLNTSSRLSCVDSFSGLAFKNIFEQRTRVQLLVEEVLKVNTNNFMAQESPPDWRARLFGRRNKTPVYSENYESSGSEGPQSGGEFEEGSLNSLEKFDISGTARAIKNHIAESAKKGSAKSNETETDDYEPNKFETTSKKRNLLEIKKEQSMEPPSKKQKIKTKSSKGNHSTRGASYNKPIQLSDSDNEEHSSVHLFSRRKELLVSTKKTASLQHNYISGLTATNESVDKDSNNPRAKDVDIGPSNRTPDKQMSSFVFQNTKKHHEVGDDLNSQKMRVQELEKEFIKLKRHHMARMDALKQEHKTQLEQQQQDNDDQSQKLKRDHESEMNKLRTETHKSLNDIQQSVNQQEQEYTQQLTTLEADNVSLQDQLKKEKTTLMAMSEKLDQRDGFSDAEASIKALQTKNAALSKEVEDLKQQKAYHTTKEANAIPSWGFTARHSPTPTPSQLAPSNEAKSNNVRNVYVRVKRRYDNIVAVSKKIIGNTANMDLASWGEFGRNINQLKRVLEDRADEDGIDVSKKEGTQENAN